MLLPAPSAAHVSLRTPSPRCGNVQTLAAPAPALCHPTFRAKGKDEIDQLDKIFQVMGSPTEATAGALCKLPRHVSRRPGPLMDVPHASALA